MTVRPEKKKISITVDEPVIKRIDEMADNAFRNRSQYINLVLKIWGDTDGLNDMDRVRQILQDRQEKI